MSRQLKFRIWDTKKDEWLGESDPNSLTYNGVTLFGETMQMQDLRPDVLEHCIVELYTGLEDKNGMEIYEGDIIGRRRYNFFRKDGITKDGRYRRSDWLDTIVVNYGQYDVNEVCIVWGHDYVPDGKFAGLNIIIEDDGTVGPYEVIGNIHQHPELLKK